MWAEILSGKNPFSINNHDGNNDERHSTRVDSSDGFLGVSRQMRAYSGLEESGGEWDGALSSSIQLYNALSTIRRLSDNDKEALLPVMRTGDILVYYSKVTTGAETEYGIASDLMTCFTNDQEEGRIFRMWQSI